MVRLNDRLDMTIVVYHGRKTTIQQPKKIELVISHALMSSCVNEQRLLCYFRKK